MIMTSSADQLRALRIRAGLSIRAIAKELQFKSQSSYQYYEDAEKFPDHLPWDFVNKLLDVLVGKGQPPIKKPEVIRLGDVSRIEAQQLPAVHNTSNESFLTVPIYDIRASAGAGALVEDGEPTGYQPYRQQELARLTRSSSDSLAVIQVAGDSMWETLHDGDKVLVDRSVERVVRDGIYVLNFEGELLVKRCQRDLETKDIIVASDNAAYKTMTVSSEHNFTVIGRVIWIGRALG